MLETINLTKRYEDGYVAVDHLSFKVEPGEIFCMFGANWAGKTTKIPIEGKSERDEERRQRLNFDYQARFQDIFGRVGEWERGVQVAGGLFS